MRRLSAKVHLWLSVPFGLAVTLICFSGTMLVFEKEVMEFVHPHLHFVEAPSSCAAGSPDAVGDSGESSPSLTVDSIAAIVAATLPEDVKVTGVTVSADTERSWKVGLSKPRRAAVHVNQYTGEILGRYERAPFFTFMFRMHRWLLDTMKPGETVFWGKIIVGVSVLMFVIVLISGIVIWWPRNAAALKNRLKISLHGGSRLFWHDLHVAGGMYAVVFLLAMALSGLTWSFQWYSTGFYRLFGAEVSATHGSAANGGSASAHAADVRTVAGKAASGPGFGNEATLSVVESANIWHRVYETLAASNADYAAITVSDGVASVSFDRLGNRRAADRHFFDADSGEITKSSLYRDADRATKLRGWIYSVHVGSWGGILTRILAFLASLLGASLPLTGYWLWIRRLAARGRVHHH